MRRFVECVAVATLAGIGVVAMVSAQERERVAPGQERDRQRTERDAQPGREQGSRWSDGQLATWLAADNEGEVELGKFAAERSQNEEVKKFARMMSDDHTKFLNQLRKFAPMSGTSPDTARQPARIDEKRATTQREDIRPDDPTKRRDRDAETTVRRGYFDPEGRIDLARVKQEIAKESLQTTKKELDEKSGADFDKCYIGLQIMMHHHAADTLKVMKNYASPELRKVIEDGQGAVQGHLDHAKHLMKQLESK
jgi:predicted outer membrane protein